MCEQRLKIKVEETLGDTGRNLVIDIPYRTAEEMSQAFRTIMYWLTFVPETIDTTVKDIYADSDECPFCEAGENCDEDHSTEDCEID